MLLSVPIMFKFQITEKHLAQKPGRELGHEYVVVGHNEKASKFLFINDEKKIDAIEEYAIRFTGFFELKDYKEQPYILPITDKTDVTYAEHLIQSEFNVKDALEALRTPDLPRSVGSAITTIQRHLTKIDDGDTSDQDN